jgi:hypothetical protein
LRILKYICVGAGLFLGAAAIAPTTAQATTITFTGGDPTPSNASFVFDHTTNTFTSFTVQWDSFTFNLLATGVVDGFLVNVDVNHPNDYGHIPLAYQGVTPAETFFKIMTMCGSNGIGCGFQAAAAGVPSPFREQFILQEYFIGGYLLMSTQEWLNIYAPSVSSTSTGGSFSISAVPAVPEPSIWVMLMLGFTGLGLMYGRTKKRSAAIAAA